MLSHLCSYSAWHNALHESEACYMPGAVIFGPMRPTTNRPPHIRGIPALHNLLLFLVYHVTIFCYHIILVFNYLLLVLSRAAAMCRGCGGTRRLSCCCRASPGKLPRSWRGRASGSSPSWQRPCTSGQTHGSCWHRCWARRQPPKSVPRWGLCAVGQIGFRI